MKPKLWVVALLALTPLAATAQQAPTPAGSADASRPPLYATQAEAEAAAPGFHCSGAHQMGDGWMPCAVHGGGHGQPMSPGHSATPAGH